MEVSQRLNLPLLAAGQSQKEVVHNESLQMLDILVGAAVEEGPRNDPPATPIAGSCFIVGAEPIGAWFTHAFQLAAFNDAGWIFVDPPEGFHAWVKALGVTAVRRGGAWDIGDIHCTRMLVAGTQVVGPQLPAIPAPVGGGTMDLEARGAIAAIVTALSQHGLIAP